MIQKNINELAMQLGQVLRKADMKMVTAESCTGGGIAQAITEIPGSSVWFDRGFVTYSNTAKLQMLDVKQQTLEKYGAVSKETAIEMVEGALRNSDADLAVSVTGIAGPDGGTEHKPVGTVYIAWMRKGETASWKHQVFFGNRNEIRQQSVEYALKCCFC